MIKELFRGVSNKELKEYNLKGIPKNKKFMTDVMMARKFGKNVVAVNFVIKNFQPLQKDSDLFKLFKIENKYFTNKKIIKRFKKLMFLD